MIKDLIPDTLTPYGDWYKIGGYNRLGRECYAMISWRNASTNVTELIGAGDSPIELSSSFADKDFFDPIAGTSCNIKIQATSYDEFIRLARGDDTEFRVRVVEKDANNNDVVLFRGFLRPETYRQDIWLHKPVVTVDATDGLGLLRKMEYPRMEGMPSYGLDYANRIIAYILYRAGNREDFEDHVMYRFSHTQINYLRSLQLAVAKYYEWDLYDVLLDILDIIKAQVVQVGGRYIIRLMDKPTDMRCEVFNHKGAYQSAYNRDDDVVNLYDNFNGVRGDLSVDRPIKKLIIKNQLTPIDNLIYNGDFSKGDTGWYDHAHNPEWTVHENTLKITNSGSFLFGGGNVADYPTLDDVPIPKVKSHTFDRGDIGRALKFLISYRIATGFDLDVFHTVQRLQTIESGDDIDLKIPQSHKIHTHSAPGVQKAILQTTHIKDVRVQCLGFATPPHPNYQITGEAPEPVGQIDKEDIVDIEQGNSEEMDIDVGWIRGNIYVHDNALHPDFIYFEHDEFPYPFPGEVWSVIKSRVKDFYSKPRHRQNVEMYVKHDSESIFSYSQLFDKHFGRTFLPLSYSYDLLKNRYDIELIEYRRATEDEFMTWILADGTWDDDGYWMDTEKWND